MTRMRMFNTTGPCDPTRHYVLPPLERTSTALGLLQSGDYLALNGPRQSGKTSLLSAIGALARVAEIDELTARIEALETAHANKGGLHA